MKIAKKLSALLLVVLMACSFASCGGGGEEVDNYIDVQIFTEVNTMDAQYATDGTSFGVIHACIEGLVSLDADGNFIDALSTEQTVSADGLTWTFKIREEAVWTNGTPVTGQDFVDAFQKLADPDFNSDYQYMATEIMQIKNGRAVVDPDNELYGKLDQLGVSAPDAKTFVVELEVPCPFMLSLLCFPSFYPRNDAFVDPLDKTYGTSAETYLSCGPFKLTDYEPSAETFTLEKNETYYDADAVKIDGLRYHVIKDSQSAVLSYENGEVDFTILDGSLVDQYKTSPEFKILDGGYLWYVSANINNCKTFGTNPDGTCKNDNITYLANENMRKALMASFDRDAIANNILKDGSVAAAFIYPVGLSTGPDGKDYRAAIDHKTAYPDAQYNVETAYAYYEAAAAELGVTDFTFELVVEDNEAAQNVAAFIQQEVAATFQNHITINLKVETKKARLEDMNAKKGNYELGLTRWGPDYADPMTYADLWDYTTSSDGLGSGWADDTYTAMIKSCKDGSLTTEERWAKLIECEKYIMDRAIIIPVYQKNDASLIKANVKGIEFHAVGLPTNYKRAYIEK